MWFDVILVLKMKNPILWAVTRYESYKRFGENFGKAHLPWRWKHMWILLLTRMDVKLKLRISCKINNNFCRQILVVIRPHSHRAANSCSRSQEIHYVVGNWIVHDRLYKTPRKDPCCACLIQSSSPHPNFFTSKWTLTCHLRLDLPNALLLSDLSTK